MFQYHIAEHQVWQYDELDAIHKVFGHNISKPLHFIGCIKIIVLTLYQSLNLEVCAGRIKMVTPFVPLVPEIRIHYTL